MQMEFTVYYPRQHSKVVYWWQLHVG